MELTLVLSIVAIVSTVVCFFCCQLPAGCAVSAFTWYCHFFVLFPDGLPLRGQALYEAHLVSGVTVFENATEDDLRLLCHAVPGMKWQRCERRRCAVCVEPRRCRLCGGKRCALFVKSAVEV